jgi:hypothetical protein
LTMERSSFYQRLRFLQRGNLACLGGQFRT